MSAEEVAKAFVGHYYQTFDGGAANLASLYVREENYCCLTNARSINNDRRAGSELICTTVYVGLVGGYGRHSCCFM